jgi:hypothetical protein
MIIDTNGDFFLHKTGMTAGGDYLLRDGSVAMTDNFDFDGYNAINAAAGSAPGNIVEWQQFDDHASSQANPHNVTKAQVGLDKVDNTSDLEKPISTAMQAALDNKSDLGHTHTKAEITDFSHTHVKSEITDFSHTHGIDEVTGLEAQLNSKLNSVGDDSIGTNALGNIVYCTENEYNALTPDEETLYIIVEDA